MMEANGNHILDDIRILAKAVRRIKLNARQALDLGKPCDVRKAWNRAYSASEEAVEVLNRLQIVIDDRFGAAPMR